MRSKLILIQGSADLSIRLTNAGFERINADNVVCSAAIRNPDVLLPCNVGYTPQGIVEKLDTLLDYWEHDYAHYLASEYASAVLDRGGAQHVKVVEGATLMRPWWRETIRAFHRLANQIIIDVKIAGDICQIEDISYTFDELVERFNPESWLG